MIMLIRILNYLKNFFLVRVSTLVSTVQLLENIIVAIENVVTIKISGRNFLGIPIEIEKDIVFCSSGSLQIKSQPKLEVLSIF